MRDLVVNEFLTLDGVMQAPGGPQEDSEGGFSHGGWQAGYFDADAGRIVDEQFESMEALLLGRVTYQIFAGYWPTATEDLDVAGKLNSMPKYVWSRTLSSVEWQNSTLMRGDLTEEVTALKQQPGSGYLGVIGSGKLAQSLMQRGLVDAFNLMIHPVVVGSGKRLFAGGVTPFGLRLVESKTTGSGITVLTYRLAGK